MSERTARIPAQLLWCCGPLLLVALAACTPSPDSLCTHLVKLVEDQFGLMDRTDPARGRRDAVARCATEQAALRRQDAKAYACYAECVVDKKRLSDAAECKTQCLPPEPPSPAPSAEIENSAAAGAETAPSSSADGAAASSTSTTAPPVASIAAPTKLPEGASSTIGAEPATRSSASKATP